MSPNLVRIIFVFLVCACWHGHAFADEAEGAPEKQEVEGDTTSESESVPSAKLKSEKTSKLSASDGKSGETKKKGSDKATLNQLTIPGAAPDRTDGQAQTPADAQANGRPKSWEEQADVRSSDSDAPASGLQTPVDSTEPPKPGSVDTVEAKGAPQSETGESKPQPEATDKSNQSGEPEKVYEATDTVTIIGRAADVARVTGSAHRIGGRELERQEQDDIHRILKQVPGIYVREEDGFGLRPNIGLRGANSDRSAKVTLMEDGVLLAPAPYSAPAAYYFPLTTRLTGIEVFKGPSAIRHGPNTIGGAINLATRNVPAYGSRGQIDIGGGLRNSGKTHVWYGHGTENMGALVEGIRLINGGFKELDSGGESGFDKSEFMLKLRFNSDHKAKLQHRLKVKLGYAIEASNEGYLGLTQADFDANPYRRYAAGQHDRMEWERSQVTATYSALWKAGFELRLVGYRNDFHRDWKKFNGFTSTNCRILDVMRSPTRTASNLGCYQILSGALEASVDEAERVAIGTNDRTYVSQGAQLTAFWDHKAKTWENHLELGARFHTDRIERDHNEADYDQFLGQFFRSTDLRTAKENQGEAQAWSFHVVNDLRLWKKLYLTPGLRTEIINTSLTNEITTEKITNQDVLILPGMGMWYGFNKHWGILAGVHLGFSPVAPGQADEVKPELSTNYEAGIRFKHRKVKGEVIGFMNDYENLSGACTQSAGCDESDLDKQFNAGRALIQGVEAALGLSHRLKSKTKLTVNLAYTHTRARFMSDFDSNFSQWDEVVRDDALPYVPEHQGSLRLGVEQKRWGFGSVLAGTGEMRDVAGSGPIPEGYDIPGHLTWDINGFWKPSKASKVYMTVDNVLGQSYMVSRRPLGIRPGKPFHIMVGYKHDFKSKNR